MSDILSYLNSPHLVANFQKIFGIEIQFNSDQQQENSNVNSSNNSNAKVKLVKIPSTAQKSADTEITQTKVRSTRIKSPHDDRTITLTETTKSSLKINGHNYPEEPPSTIQQSNISDNNTNNDSSSGGKSSSHKRQLSGVKQLVNNTDHTNIIANTTIHSQFWYYFFLLGALMGNEIFFSLFFPFWFWNVDGAIARKVAFLWGIFMYFGQATKDLVCSPRPASPPVVKLEERCIAEYGFPSTHAMISAGLPISLVFLSYQRYNINLPASIAIAACFCCWVCCSRLYLGMHSILDVVAGVLYSMLVLILVIPILEPIDKFMMENDYSPYIALIVGFIMCYYYPSLKQWSTARGDTTIIVGTVAGFSVGAYLNYHFGLMNRPTEPPLYDIHFPNAVGYLFGVVRTILGAIVFITTRQLLKKSLLRFLCYIHGLDYKDPASKRLKIIELPYNYFSYFIIAINIAFTSPCLFRMLNIERDYSYTEL